jgi:hypothetical protein
VKETVDGEWATAVWFGWYWATVRVDFGEALVLVMAPVAVATATATGGPPPSNNSAREVLVRRVDGASSSCNGG